MRKVRIIWLTVTIILAIIILIGIVAQIFSSRPPLDSAYEIIAFIVSGVSVTVALLSQISAYRERKEYSKIIHELNATIAAIKAEKAIDEKIRNKLDELIALNHRIYGRIAKQTKSKIKP